MTEESKNQTRKITLLSFMGSLFAGRIGVQSKANRDRDFEHGKFSHFIIGGIIFVILFVLSVVGIAKVVMSSVGA